MVNTLAVSGTNVLAVVAVVAGIGLFAAAPWLMALGEKQQQQQPPDPLKRLPFGASMLERAALLLLVVGLGRCLGGNASSGFVELAIGAAAAIGLGLWAARHPGYRWFRRQKPRQ